MGYWPARRTNPVPGRLPAEDPDNRVGEDVGEGASLDAVMVANTPVFSTAATVAVVR